MLTGHAESSCWPGRHRSRLSAATLNAKVSMTTVRHFCRRAILLHHSRTGITVRYRQAVTQDACSAFCFHGKFPRIEQRFLMLDLSACPGRFFHP